MKTYKIIPSFQYLILGLITLISAMIKVIDLIFKTSLIPSDFSGLSVEMGNSMMIIIFFVISIVCFILSIIWGTIIEEPKK